MAHKGDWMTAIYELWQADIITHKERVRMENRVKKKLQCGW